MNQYLIFFLLNIKVWRCAEWESVLSRPGLINTYRFSLKNETRAGNRNAGECLGFKYSFGWAQEGYMLDYYLNAGYEKWDKPSYELIKKL